MNVWDPDFANKDSSTNNNGNYNNYKDFKILANNITRGVIAVFKVSSNTNYWILAVNKVLPGSPSSPSRDSVRIIPNVSGKVKTALEEEKIGLSDHVYMWVASNGTSNTYNYEIYVRAPEDTKFYSMDKYYRALELLQYEIVDGKDISYQVYTQLQIPNLLNWHSNRDNWVVWADTLKPIVEPRSSRSSLEDTHTEITRTARVENLTHHLNKPFHDFFKQMKIKFNYSEITIQDNEYTYVLNYEDEAVYIYDAFGDYQKYISVTNSKDFVKESLRFLNLFNKEDELLLKDKIVLMMRYYYIKYDFFTRPVTEKRKATISSIENILGRLDVPLIYEEE